MGVCGCQKDGLDEADTMRTQGGREGGREGREGGEGGKEGGTYLRHRGWSDHGQWQGRGNGGRSRRRCRPERGREGGRGGWEGGREGGVRWCCVSGLDVGEEGGREGKREGGREGGRGRYLVVDLPAGHDDFLGLDVGEEGELYGLGEEEGAEVVVGGEGEETLVGRLCVCK